MEKIYLIIAVLPAEVTSDCLPHIYPKRANDFDCYVQLRRRPDWVYPGGGGIRKNGKQCGLKWPGQPQRPRSDCCCASLFVLRASMEWEGSRVGLYAQGAVYKVCLLSDARGGGGTCTA